MEDLYMKTLKWEVQYFVGVLELSNLNHNIYGSMSFIYYSNVHKFCGKFDEEVLKAEMLLLN